MFADRSKHAVPIQRKFEVAQRPFRGSVRIFLVRKQHGRRYCYTEARGERVVEEFVVGRAPKGIVDDRGSVQRGMLEERAIKRNVVGDAIENDGVARRLMEMHCSRLNKLSLNAGRISVVDPLDQSAGETVLHAEQHANPLHDSPIHEKHGFPGPSVRHRGSRAVSRASFRAPAKPPGVRSPTASSTSRCPGPRRTGASQ